MCLIFRRFSFVLLTLNISADRYSSVLLFAFLHVTSLYLLRMHNFVQEMHVTEFAYLFLFIFFFL